jgi:hypothetical protein
MPPSDATSSRSATWITRPRSCGTSHSRTPGPDPNNPSMLYVVDEHGEVVSLPLHRIHQVLSNGETIWQRDTPPRVSQRH